MAFVGAAIARADHDAMIGRFFATEINHRVCNVGIAIDRISAAPKKKIARFEVIELKGVVAVSEHSLEIARFAHPNVLLARIARHVADSVF